MALATSTAVCARTRAYGENASSTHYQACVQARLGVALDGACTSWRAYEVGNYVLAFSLGWRSLPERLWRIWRWIRCPGTGGAHNKVGPSEIEGGRRHVEVTRGRLILHDCDAACFRYRSGALGPVPHGPAQDDRDGPLAADLRGAMEQHVDGRAPPPDPIR